MKLTRTFVLLSAAVVLAVLAGCTRGANDDQIARNVQSKLASNATIASRQITASSNNGVVTLSGEVASEGERSAAANDAAQVEGVKTVINNLQVTPAAAANARSGSVLRAPARSGAAPAPAPAGPGTVTLPSGTEISVRMIDSVDTERNKAGDTFHASLASPIVLDGRIAVPKNADLEGQVVELESAGRFAGRSSLALVLSGVTVNGRSYPLETEQYVQQGSSRGKRTAAVVGGGAAAGAVIGGIAAGGKGAAIGAGAGAAAGTGVEAATKGQQIRIPSETLVDFRLKAPVTIVPSSGEPNAGRPRVG